MINNAFTLAQNPISVHFILDSKLETIAPINNLKLNFKVVDQVACQMLGLRWNSTFDLKCTLN